MNWFKKILGSTAKKNVDQAVSNPTDYTIDILMSNLCDIEKSLPILEDAGISREAISKTYNLTVIACARGMLESTLAREQLPDFYVLSDKTGVDHEIQFGDCETYQAAKRLVKNYGQAEAIVASMSGQMRALNWCFNQLGEEAKANTHRIRLLPPRLPSFGQAETKAKILPSNA